MSERRLTTEHTQKMNLEEYNKCVEEDADGLYRFIVKSMRDADRAQDVVQDAFEKLWMKSKEVDAAKAKSYLFSTAYHRMIDVFRKENRMGELDEYTAGNLETNRSDGYSDLKEILDEAVLKLPEIQRSVLMMRDYEGYSYKEIGDITGLNEGQVKVYIFRARKFLKSYIGSMDKVI